LTAPTFVHLRVHTEYSLVDGVVRVKPLMMKLADLNMPAVALTDQSNLFAMVKFYKAALGAGIKPVIGVDAWVNDTSSQDQPYRMLLLCQNNDGYHNLSELVSKSYLKGQHRGIPVIQTDRIHEHSGGLIALSGGRDGDIGRMLVSGKTEEAEQRLQEWQATFGDRYYLELQRTGRENEEHYIHEAVNLALKTDTPVVATNDVRFLKPEDYDAHEVRVCIHEGRTLDDPRRTKNYSEQQYLRSAEEMQALFEDIPEALANTVEIVKRCNLEVRLGESFLPQYPIPEGETEDSYFARVSREGLEQRLEILLDKEAEDYAERRKAYEERLRIEIDVIVNMGFPGYFLIVADFIQWSKDNGIPVGPGRGSGAGSLVAYALKITDLDPLAFDLLFERFLNPERVSLPDFDVDFCMDRRDEVIDYVARTYGRDSVSQIITYGTMAAKAVVRDVGRVMGQPYGFVDRIAKMIPFEIGMTLTKALDESEDLKKAYDEEEDVHGIIDMALSLEGLARNAGKHAGGVVISPTVLTDFTPLYCEEGGNSVVTQFDKDDVESVGLVKFDFLGLRTLTIIDWAVKHINRRREREGANEEEKAPLDIATIPLDDPDAFKLLQAANTTAVFQLESRGMKDLITRLQPDTFEDIVALVALFRPGPLQSGMVDDFINRKHGRMAVDYPHPDLEPILKPTYGVILYQEQVMQIAQVLAGYSLGGADMLRRAMGKKKAEVMAEQRDIFMKGATERGVDADNATYIFDLMEKFAGYGFNKCVHGDTRVMDPDSGQWHRVEDLFKRGARPRVHACDDDYRLVPRQVEDVVWNGIKPVYRLRTLSGREIQATGNHPFKTLSGWVNLEDLKPGDRVAQSRVLQTSSSTSWPEHELIVLAGLLSEGNTCHPANLFFYNNDDELIEDFAWAAEQFPNTAARISCYDGVRKEVCLKRARRVPWNSPEFEANRYSGARLWAEQLVILHKSVTQKALPDAVFELCDADIELFIGRLWSGDGSMSLKHTTLYYATSSEQLADGLTRLLMRLGIHARIHKKAFRYRNQIKPGYAVHLVGTQSLQRFAERVLPHVIGREQDCRALIEHVNAVGEKTSRDTIPADVRKIVNAARQDQGMTWNELEAASGCSMKEFTGNGSANKKGFRHGIIARLANTLEEPQLDALANSDIVWDEIESIEYVGDFDTYDLQVEEHHNFVAEGLVVHNSHSAAYALLSYHTAWLKHHYPAEFMAAVLSSDMDNTDKVVGLIEDCHKQNLAVHPPDINQSVYQFSVHDPKTVIYGLGAIKGVGGAALDGIIEEREANGPFKDLYDFCKRNDTRKVNRRVMEALIKAGALDALGSNRASLMASLNNAMQLADQHHADAQAGQNDLFGGDSAPEKQTTVHVVEVDDWEDDQRLFNEKETLGLYLTGHPIDKYETELRQFTDCSLADVAGIAPADSGNGYRQRGKQCRLAGLMISLRVRKTARGGKMVTAVLDDRTARIEMTIFDDVNQEFGHLLQKDKLLIVEGTVSWDDFNGSYNIRAKTVYDITQAREHFSRCLEINVDKDRINGNWSGAEMVQELTGVLQTYREGSCPVCVYYNSGTEQSRMMLGDEWKIQPTDELLHRLEGLLSDGMVRMVY
jgi:DNA polymerase-3 subunit alpha